MKKNKVILVGFQGAGKTTLGKMLASELNCQFYDIDGVMADIYGEKPRQGVIAQHGKDITREIESEVTINILNQDDYMVVALGGGGFDFQKTRAYILSNFNNIIYIDRNFDDMWNDTRDKITGPMSRDKESAEQKYYNRLDIYAEAKQHLIVSKGVSVEATYQQLKEILAL